MPDLSRINFLFTLKPSEDIKKKDSTPLHDKSSKKTMNRGNVPQHYKGYI
jgi:hypothetical protein